MRPARLSIPLMGILSMVLAGCGQSTIAATRQPLVATSATLKASIDWRPNPPVPLKNWNLSVVARNRQGDRVPRSTRVTVTIRMTSMDMPPIRDTLHWVSPGTYHGSVIIVMPGTMRIVVRITSDSEHLKKVFTIVTTE